MAAPESPATILVVEDELVLRMRAVDIVEEAGFTAVEAADADQALAILEKRSDIALLLSDIQMPGSMDGVKLAHAVHERWPAIKIILVSGRIKLEEADRPAASRFFGKPLEDRQIIAELRSMLGEIPPPMIHSADNDVLAAENDSLRFLLAQAGISAKALLAQAGIEAKEREAADKLQKLILEEMHHRIKNTLSTVSAIASQSLRNATSIDHAQQAIEGRLVALGRAHDLLMQTSWANAGLTSTVRSATEPYDAEGGGRFAIHGPDVAITSGAVIALAMTFNELCTNTTKFGALTLPEGRIDIGWTLDDAAERLSLTWTETGGPLVRPATRRSFGTRMMQSLGLQLNGQVRLDYQPTGFVYTLDAPLTALTAKASAVS
jgi:two-component sensor histidine kinase/CheY-like chemotaxis protein